MTVLAPGLHTDIPAEHYHADPTGEPALSASIAKVLLTKSPLHAWHQHPKLNPAYQQTHTSSFDLGTAAHTLFLEGEKFAEKVATIDAKDWRTKAAQVHREAAREAGMVPLLADDWRRVVEMAGAIRDQLAARSDEPPLFADGKPEVTLVWRDKATDVLCRARLDWLRDDHTAIDDLKSTAVSANPYDWGRRTFWTIGADIQARLYQRGIKALTGQTPKFRFTVVETQAPYCLSVFDLSPAAIELADQKIDAALSIWKRCLDSGTWPGYDPRVASVEVAWQEAEFMTRHWVEDEKAAA